MQVIYLDQRIVCLEDFYQRIATALAPPSYFGRNLDALHDFLLGEYSGALHVVWRNWKTVQRSLGPKIFRRIILFFKACQREKSDLFMSFVNNDNDKDEIICQFEVSSTKSEAPMTGYFELNSKDQEYWLDFIGSDGKILLHGQSFASARDVLKELKRLRKALQEEEHGVFRSIESGRIFELQVQEGDSKVLLASSAAYRSVGALQQAVELMMGIAAKAPLIRLF